MRGSAAAWEALLETPERISDDTLYFIYQNAQTSTDGKLYLGQKLISGTGGNFTGRKKAFNTVRFFSYGRISCQIFHRLSTGKYLF